LLKYKIEEVLLGRIIVFQVNPGFFSPLSPWHQFAVIGNVSEHVIQVAVLGLNKVP
jgi:hypothetical protein